MYETNRWKNNIDKRFYIAKKKRKSKDFDDGKYEVSELHV